MPTTLGNRRDTRQKKATYKNAFVTDSLSECKSKIRNTKRAIPVII